jgi:hypothetical protein
MTSDQVAAEQLIARLGDLTAAPARIVRDNGLRRRRGMNGFTLSTSPAELHVDPAAGRPGLLRTAAHEWIHSLEFRGILARGPLDERSCTASARAHAPAIASQALISPSVVALPQELVAAIFAQTGRAPVCFAGARRGIR